VKIGDLFIALGFKVTGAAEFDAAKAGLKHAAIDATKLTVAVNAANAGLLALVAYGMRAAVEMKNFAVSTGLSTTELQKWQHNAEVNDVSGQELASTIKELQDVRASFALGEPKNVGAWTLLGVDPTQDPFVVLDQLRTKLKGFSDVGVARNLAERVGIGPNVFQMLRSSNDEFSKWKQQFEVTKAQQARLIALNRAWKDLLFSVKAIRTQFASDLAPAFQLVARGVSWLARKLSDLATWLGSNVPVARFFKMAIGGLAIASLALGAALVVITTALGALSAAFALASPTLAALLPVLGSLAAFIAVLSVSIAALILLVDDMFTSFAGGKSLTRDIGEWLAGFKAIQVVIEAIWFVWDKVIAGFKAIPGGFEKFFAAMYEQSRGDSALRRQADDNKGAAWFAPRTQAAAGQTTVKQDNKISIAIDGAQSPAATAKEVNRSLGKEVQEAWGQMAVPNL
jgi:hypothetical protein